MKRRLVVCFVATIVAVVMVLVGIRIAPKKPTVLADPITVYQNAADKLNTLSGLAYRIQISTAVSAASQIFREDSDILFQYQGKDSENYCQYVQETFSSGTLKTDITELYCNGQLYVTVSDGKFVSKFNESDLTERYVPPTLFDCNLYQTIHGIAQNDLTTITFQSASAGEGWAVPQGAVFQSSSGSAYLDSNGNLLRSQYDIAYEYNGAIVTKTVIAEIVTTDVPQLALPADADFYIPIDYIDGPRMLERVSGQLTQLTNAAVHYEEYTLCQAFGDERTKISKMKLRSTAPLDVELDTTITLKNKSLGGEQLTQQTIESFSDNKYTNTQDGIVKNDNAVTEPIMLEYCQNTLLGTIMLPEYIASVAILHADDSVSITFTGNDFFAESISQNICQTLYGDPTVLTNRAADHYTKSLECYIVLDSTTGQIRSSGIHYSSVYNIDGFPYALEFRADQNYMQ